MTQSSPGSGDPDPSSEMMPLDQLRLLLAETIWLESQVREEAHLVREAAARIAKLAATAALTAEQAGRAAASFRRTLSSGQEPGLHLQDAVATVVGIIRLLTETANGASHALTGQAASMSETVGSLRQSAEATGRLAGQLLTLA